MAKHKDVYIIGGKQIYELFENYCDELIISHLKKSYQCDTFYKPYLKFFRAYKTISHKEFDIVYYKSIYNKILDGKKVADALEAELVKKQHELKQKYHVVPHLAIVQVGDLDASNLYIKKKLELGQKLNLKVTHHKLDQNISQKELNQLIEKLNQDKKVNGILVQSPLANKNLDMNEVANLIDPCKDVDCFNAFNAGKIFRNEPTELYPCTPAGVMHLIHSYKIPLKAKHVVILGRSNIVTKPLAMMMLYEDATVTICHSKTKNLNHYLKDADIICAAAGQVNLVNKNNIKKDAIVIDISMNYDANHKLCGDVNFNEVIDKVKYICPVPRGIGPLTLIMLFKNLLFLTIRQITNSDN